MMMMMMMSRGSIFAIYEGYGVEHLVGNYI